MKTIIAGSRDAHYGETMIAIYSCPWDITGIVSGCARGPDSHGINYGRLRNIPIYMYPADWKAYGKRAGHIRNCEMARNAEALIAVWDGQSRGTKHMIDEAINRGLRLHVYKLDEVCDI